MHAWSWDGMKIVVTEMLTHFILLLNIMYGIGFFSEAQIMISIHKMNSFKYSVSVFKRLSKIVKSAVHEG